MKMIRWMSTMILLAACFAIAATGSSVEGRWQGKMNTASGEATITFNFEVKGQVLTGTTETPAGSQTINDGKVNGDRISFKTTVNGHVIGHEGTVSGDTIQLKNNGPFGEFDLVIKRVSGGG
jgi:hypothetical protein